MIHHGDLFDVLPTLEANSIDACVTDPPYELGFMGKGWDKSGVANRPETWAAVARVLKPGAYLLAFGGTRTFHRMTCAIEDAGFEIRDSLAWIYGQGFPKSLNVGDGRGTALKPAWEPVIVARKPFTGTVAANLERYGTGALNIDACRIEGVVPSCTQGQSQNAGMIFGADQRSKREFIGHDSGRWPANVVLDEDAARLLDEQSGELTSGAGDKGNKAIGLQGYGSNVRAWSSHEYSINHGGASRFFYCPKPSREERDYGTEGLDKRDAHWRENGLIKDRTWIDKKDGKGRVKVNARLQPRGNHHPTVKPVELMRWLVKLVTPPNGTVLDPFLGSGTTGMACRYEQRGFIGIEREAEYVAIAERRIAAVAPLFHGPDLPLTGTR